ncbi:MAG TPA: site-2 protease family protein [Pyrinomonadaceae bacterium]|jgi:membrane-associated protease RseP (regulator of RpoE activity)
MSVQSIPPVFPPETFYVPRALSRPTAREWARHAGLLLLTMLTATLAGVTLATGEADIPAPALAAPAHWFEYIYYVPAYYALTVAGLVKHALAQPGLLVQGATFAGALLAILLAHECGHYVACRRYGVQATLPYFLPAPPLFLAGTFGAFIKIKSPIPTRRALFDIGVAGPLAGFVVLIPVALAAVLTARPEPLPAAAAAGGGLVIFNDPPLLRLLAHALRVPFDNIAFNPFYFAAWIGLLVTSLNLLPVGQLDGGHAVFAVAGARVHRWVGRGAFALMCALAFLGWRWHGAPSGFIYALLLFVMLRVRHPQAEDERAPLGRARLVVAALTLAVFLLCFELFPLTIT